jgi:hypothetical protein
VKRYIITIIVAFVVGLSLGMFGRPTKVITKTETVYKDRIVEKVIEHQVIVTKEIKKPDGTDEIDTVTKTDDQDDKKSDLTGNSNTSKEVDYGSGIQIGGMAGTNLSNGQQVYGGYANKRLIGPITVGGFGLSNGTAGLTLGVEF